jgi:hypothetical protein
MMVAAGAPVVSRIGTVVRARRAPARNYGMPALASMQRPGVPACRYGRSARRQHVVGEGLFDEAAAGFWLIPIQAGVPVPGGSTEMASTVQGVARALSWLADSRQAVKDQGPDAAGGRAVASDDRAG